MRMALLFLVPLLALHASTEDGLQWPAIGPEQRPGCYWWWMASGVDEANITMLLDRYQQAGLGGVHIIPIYGAKGYEDRYVQYLSTRWLELLNYTVSEGNRFNLWVDMTTGTGWCFGGPNISEKQANCLVQHTVQDVKGGESVSLPLQKDAVQAAIAYGPGGRVENLTEKIAADGTLAWQAPEGDWKLYVVTQKFSGRYVKRAAPGGEGFMLNPFYGDAINTYLKRFDDAFGNYDGLMPRAQYHDSFEYVCDWSPDMFDEFQKRRGYDLRAHLPALFSENNEDEVCRVKTDYCETVSDMLLENFTRVWVDWAHKHGCVTRDQAHGSPGNLLDLYAASDIPETEMFNKDRDPLIAKFSSSAAHVTGKTKVASETGTWLREHFTVTLADLKDLVDELFVSGVNHVIYHGNCYSPADAPWPGWLFYASTQMNPRNSIWHDARALNDYIARCQAVLQSGEPDNDILLYWPVHDSWHQPEGLARNMTVHKTEWFTTQAVCKTASELWKRGYTFDYVSDRQLAACSMRDGDVETSGNKYKIIVVPAVNHMPVATMEALMKLASQGVKVVIDGPAPSDVPGMANLEERRAQLRRLTTALPKSMVAGGNLEQMLADAVIEREPLVDHAGLRFIRRRHDSGRWYFVTLKNDAQAVDGWVTFETPMRGAALFDPMTGKTAMARQNGRKIYMQLAPGQSMIVKTWYDGAPTSPEWPYVTVAGDGTELKGPWQVQFIEGGPEMPSTYSTEKLGSWTGRGDENADRFAGTGRYIATFELPAVQADAWRVDLGRVAESAHVTINGVDCGTIFAPPFRVDVPADALKPAGNVIQIDVTNLTANRIRDLDRRGVEWKKFNDANIVNIDYKPFDASDWPVRESGLLGPVVLTPMKRVEPAK